ncbi:MULTISPECIES: GerW family sporulation protein [Bacillales]|jgi:sporulation protein YtfJ|uniref:GerW family sporulation protein n=1 Tax=Brevibacillus aydinogluensis TaxID=927786 RepID=A0AA48M5R7_9BACL|nr:MULTISPECIES: GerW family sporulation protein [Bacillales]REK61646.1 MAG: sporulation protein YtfJ [Brevibacillus sp.]MBR8660272.1 GerW family sporulation protein [Brevibacillus sp. NL20B1]MDT3416687.1 sporulation protein YtfJ [Brevibacillus aydinogluensis]NNV04108.1 sporulation protein YtfJ [Brevibacillus sp. MCWH]UFJ61370.1 GerW family sporulation protein [Anoxybacillus sediminis]
MADHPIQGLMRTAMENIKQMVDVNTIIGDPVETPDGSVILPISKVGFGFAAGGSEFQYEKDHAGVLGHPFGGGSGGGVSITPVAFLVVGKQGIRSIPLENTTHLYDRILDSIPQVVDKLQSLMGKKEQASVTSTTYITDADEHDLEELIKRS